MVPGPSATPGEVAARLPGDDAFPATREVSTRAITIAALPDVVYARDIVAYEVLQADPGEALVVAAGSLTREQLFTAVLPETWTENAMGWVLRPTEDGGTRLLLRKRSDGTETGFARWMWNGSLNFGGAMVSRKALAGIKRVAEGGRRRHHARCRDAMGSSTISIPGPLLARIRFAAAERGDSLADFADDLDALQAHITGAQSISMGHAATALPQLANRLVNVDKGTGRPLCSCGLGLDCVPKRQSNWRSKRSPSAARHCS